MKKLLAILSTVVLSLVLGSFAEAQDTSVITGTVVDASTGRPLPGARVELLVELEADPLFQTYASPTGQFRFEALEGVYVLRATRIAYAEAVVTVPAESLDVSDRTLRLVPSFIRIRPESEQPLRCEHFSDCLHLLARGQGVAR